jgi:DNA-binding PadR family transcriptional regulator
MLGKLEEFVLLGLQSRGPDAMAAAVYEAIADDEGALTTFGAVFTTLDRLVEKKFVTVKTLDPSPASKKRPRKVYTISAVGRSALNESLSITQQMVARTGYVFG